MKNLLSLRRMALAGATVGLLAAAPASADYMSECDALIQAWNDCRAAGATRCAAEEQRLIDECKCHERRGNEWVFVRGSLSSGVCNAGEPPTIITPPPPPEEPRELIDPRRGGGGGGDGEERGGDDGEERGGGDDNEGGSASGSSMGGEEPRTH